MRETRLFDYAVPAEATAFPSHHITVPLFAPPPTFTPGTWSSLVRDTLSWRVETASSIIFENIITHKGFILNFSSPLTCRPLFTVEPQSILLTAVSYGNRNTCTVLHIRINPSFENSASSPCEELARATLTGTTVTTIARVDDDIVAGLSDGNAAVVGAPSQNSTNINLSRFAPLPFSKVDHRRDQGEDTSMVSRESTDSVSSNRSMASSMSMGLMNRLFGGSPRVSNPGNRMPGASVDHSHIQLSSHFRESLRARNASGDGVLAVANVKAEAKALFTLHESGRICMFICRNAQYQFVGDTALPVKLSAAKVDQFLLTGQNGSAIAVVISDEDPSADSLCVYNVTSKLRQNSAVLSCTHIAKRDGPIGRVVSAVFTGDDVVVGTDSGALSGLLNVSSEIDGTTGIPSGTIWTAVDDVDKPFGLGRALDEVSPTYRGPLVSAHRFSAHAVAKALRSPDSMSVTRDDVLEAVNTLEFEDDEDSMWKRLKVRAEQIAKIEDMRVRDVTMIDGAGIVVARQSCMYILRGLAESERKAFGNCSQLLNDRVSCAKGEVARALSSHAVCQVLASEYRVANVAGHVDQKVSFMLSICSRFSEIVSGVPLSDILLGGFASSEHDNVVFPDFSTAIRYGLSVIEPGSKLLTGLLESSEFEPLTAAAEQAADTLPISAMFASGIAWLGMYRKESSKSSDGTGAGGLQEEAFVQEDDRLENMLKKAYGFLVAAAQWCDREDASGDEDSQCAIGLAGLSTVYRRSFEYNPADANAVMTDGPTPSSLLPNGPNEKLTRAHLGFWLLERSVRLLESSGAPKDAAAAALEAMDRAPDAKRHEMMRAAAFSRFLDAGDLEQALTAIISDPFQGRDDSLVFSEESGALRDAFGLFVNAVADYGKLKWLAEYDLPEPLRVLCGQALERRARAADPLHIGDYIIRNHHIFHPSYDKDLEIAEEDRRATDYELQYSWHIMREDAPSAAAAALEWAERLTREGQGLVHRVINGKPPILVGEHQIRLMLVWVRAKQDALTLASAAAQLRPRKERYIARSRFSILLQEQSGKCSAVVDVEWVLRRQLLAHAQCKCLITYLSQCERGEAPDVRYLMGPGSPFLGETREGVAWAVSMLSNEPSYENMSLTAELCRAWEDEIGDGPLRDAVRLAARNASSCGVKDFSYSDLDKVLQELISAPDSKRSKRNWYLIAFESALAMLSGTRSCPQWLLDAAAWGTTPFGNGTNLAHRQFTGRVRGDAASVVRTFLRYNRPTDAARVLLSGLAAQEKRPRAPFYVPYSAIDATLEILSQLSDAFPDAELYHRKLSERATAHLTRMDEMTTQAEEEAEEEARAREEAKELEVIEDDMEASDSVEVLDESSGSVELVDELSSGVDSDIAVMEVAA